MYEMDSLIQKVSGYPSGTVLVIEWMNGRKVKGWLDTIFETDNGLELDEDGYEEYFALLVKIQSILQEPLQQNEKYAAGSLIEVSARDNLSKISLEDGTVVWHN